jgi:Calcineurin-like phosphoesterase
MQFVSDPPIRVKISKMKERVRWQDPSLLKRGIDQTRIAIADGASDNPEFSFLVVGDSGSGAHGGDNPQRRVAELMWQNSEDCRFVLHTGDVIYLVGSSEYYWQNFIQPYQELLVGGENPKGIAYDRMVFNLPFLPVPGNHDYYDLPVFYGLLMQASWPLRRLLRSKIDLDVGWHGSFQGRAYAKAFLDYLKAFNTEQELEHHLDTHYITSTETGRCLRYEPGQFTRLPNRYYTFRYGGIDFFALDSNTFNAPVPLPDTKKGQVYRRELEKLQDELEKQKLEIMETSENLNPNLPEEAEQLDDLRAKLEQIEEVTIDIEKQLAANEATFTDYEQLEWLQQRLIESWNTKEVRGRVVYFHHPPYVTEATKWHQAQTLAVRHRLRGVLNGVSKAVGKQAEGLPLVDLFLFGHAHCLEYLRTEDTGGADSHLNWIVCGGSGHSLRRQRTEGPELTEMLGNGEGQRMITVARSHLFIGRHGQGLQKRRPYSCLRIDVFDGRPPKFVVRPFVTELSQRQWKNSEIEPFTL